MYFICISFELRNRARVNKSLNACNATPKYSSNISFIYYGFKLDLVGEIEHGMWLMIEKCVKYFRFKQFEINYK